LCDHIQPYHNIGISNNIKGFFYATKALGNDDHFVASFIPNVELQGGLLIGALVYTTPISETL